MTVWPNGLKTIPRVTSEFGPRKAPLPGASTFHRGTDLVGFSINKSPCDGIVAFAAYNGGAGNMVTIRADNGDRFLLMHNSRLLVRAGQRVAEGQEVGVMGTTGNSTGVHTHEEIHVNGVPVDPRIYMAAALAASLQPAGSSDAPVPINQGEKDMIRISDGVAHYLVGGTNITHLSGPESAALDAAGISLVTLSLPQVQEIEKSMRRLVNLADVGSTVWGTSIVHKNGIQGPARDWLVNMSDAVGRLGTTTVALTAAQIAELKSALGADLKAQIAKGESAQTATILAAISGVDEATLVAFGLRRA